MTIKEKLSIAKARLVLSFPFFASLVISMNIQEKADLNPPTMATDGRNIFFHPDFVDKCSIDELIGVLAHEGCHVGFLHHTRRGSRHHIGWNLACVRGDTLISMADGTFKQIKEVVKGDKIFGEIDGGIVEATVLTTLSKYDDIMEVCFQNGDVLYCTPTHRVLTERGYIETRNLKENETACLDTRARHLHQREFNHNDNYRYGKSFGSELQTSGLLSLQQESLFSKKDSEKVKSEISGSISNRLGLYSWYSGWGREHKFRTLYFLKNWKSLLQTTYNYNQHKLRISRIFHKVGVLRNFREKQLWKTLLENNYKRISDSRFIKPIIALFNSKETSSSFNYRAYINSLGAETQRQTNYENEGYTPRDKRIKYERIKTIRRLEQKELVFDLTTTSHSYIANGVICHNCDMAINPILKESGLTLPQGALFGPKGSYAEEIYEKLPKDDRSGKGKSKHVAWGEVIDPSGTGPNGKATREEIKAAEQEAKVKIIQAIEQSKNRGNIPAGIERLVQEILEPKVDWRQLLRNLIDQVARNDYNWQTPNRRFISCGMYLPSVKSRELGTVVVAEDTSGSVGQKALNQFNSEVSNILEEFDTNVWLLPTDVKVHNPQEFTRHDMPLKAKVCGGGGTSFAHPFEWVEEQDINPTVLIYLTDGYCDEYPKFSPSYPVIWVYTEQRISPPFGDVIWMDLNTEN